MNEKEKRTLLRRIGEWLGLTERDNDNTQRALASAQIISQAWSQLEYTYGYDFWILDIFYDTEGMPFVVVASGGKLYRHSVMVSGDTATLGASVPVVQEFMPTARTTTTIKRQADGRYRWFSVSASSVLNRVGEIDSRALFDSFVEHAEKTGEYPIRQFYHAGESFKTGQADFLARDENLYLTSGIYDDTELAQREVKARLADPDFWGDSIGYLSTAPRELVEVSDGVTIAVYRQGINTEISTLPESEAANLFTANTEVLEMRRAMLDARQKEALVKMFGGGEEEAEAWLAENVDARNRAIENDKLITRSNGDGVEAVETETEVTETEIEIDATEITAAVLESESIQQLIKSVQELTTAFEASQTGQQRAVEELLGTVEALKVEDLLSRIEALEADDDAKQREWQQNQPRRFLGQTKHIVRPRVARSGNEENEETESFADRASQTLAAKGIPNY